MTENEAPHILTFEDRFSVVEKTLTSGFSTDEICDLNQACHDVLNAVILLEQMAIEQAACIPKQHPSDLAKLEQKVDFLTELMANVLLSQMDLPMKQDIQMSREHIVWQSASALENGQYCLLSLYLTRKYPLPLQLPIIVTDRQQENRYKGQILLSDEQVTDDLTRLVFLFHRRQIAREKSKITLNTSLLTEL